MLDSSDYTRPRPRHESPASLDFNGFSLHSPSSSSAFTSVIIRSLGRQSIHKALVSLANQTHSEIEVVVVDATGGKHPPLPAKCGPFPLRMVSNGKTLNRPQAANLGLDHALGDWLVYLDDDDFFDVDHLSRLHRAARHDGVPVAYAGTRLLDNDDRVIGVLNERFSRLRLLASNYMQMGAVLFHRILVDRGCRFDEEMLLFQDWDFWLQLAMHTHFAHSALLTNNWRVHAGQSGAGDGTNANQALQREYGERIRKKWARTQEKLIGFVQHTVRFSNEEIKHGRPEHAVKVLRRALTVTPNDPSLINLLGLASANAGDLTTAWYALCEAQALLPKNEAIRRNLEHVARLRQ